MVRASAPRAHSIIPAPHSATPPPLRNPAPHSVIPAKAGIHPPSPAAASLRQAPACAGATKRYGWNPNMSLRPLPDFLKHGDEALGLPHRKSEVHLRSLIGTAKPDLPPPGDWGSHDATSAGDALAVEWLQYLWAGRIG